MRMITDLLDNITNSIRMIFGFFALVMICYGLFVTVGASYVAPAAIDGIAEKALEANERQIEAARNYKRNRELAKDGWGYDDGSTARDDLGARSPRPKEGWADD